MPVSEAGHEGALGELLELRDLVGLLVEVAAEGVVLGVWHQAEGVRHSPIEVEDRRQIGDVEDVLIGVTDLTEGLITSSSPQLSGVWVTRMHPRRRQAIGG